MRSPTARSAELYYTVGAQRLDLLLLCPTVPQEIHRNPSQPKWDSTDSAAEAECHCKLQERALAVTFCHVQLDTQVPQRQQGRNALRRPPV